MLIATLAPLIAQYGYLAIAVGCFVEGEASILLGMLAVHNGLLAPEWVIASAIAGTLLGDNAWLLIGRHTGRRVLLGRPHWRTRTIRVEQLLHRYGAPVMIGFRFLYGLRYVTPFTLGTLGIAPWRFFFYDLIGTLLWAAVMGVVGYYLAEAIAGALDQVKHFELVLLAGVVALAIIGYIVYRIWTRRKQG